MGQPLALSIYAWDFDLLLDIHGIMLIWAYYRHNVCLLQLVKFLAGWRMGVKEWNLACPLGIGIELWWYKKKLKILITQKFQYTFFESMEFFSTFFNSLYSPGRIQVVIQVSSISIEKLKSQKSKTQKLKNRSIYKKCQIFLAHINIIFSQRGFSKGGLEIRSFLPYGHSLAQKKQKQTFHTVF